MDKSLIYIDEKDNIIGYGEKIHTHRIGQLHRAYSLFVYCKNEQKLLLQKRSVQKYHSGGKWSNSFCSHPYKDETWFEALQRGAVDELNLSLNISKDICCNSKDVPGFIDDNLFFAGSFIYLSDYKDLSEHECDYVFVYVVESIITNILFNTAEVSEVMWRTKDDIKTMLNRTPNDFSSWFSKAFDLLENNFEIVENKYKHFDIIEGLI